MEQNINDQLKCLDAVIDAATKMKDKLFEADVPRRNISVISLISDEHEGKVECAFFGIGEDIISTITHLLIDHPDAMPLFIDAVKKAALYNLLEDITIDDDEDE